MKSNSTLFFKILFGVQCRQQFIVIEIMFLVRTNFANENRQTAQTPYGGTRVKQPNSTQCNKSKYGRGG